MISLFQKNQINDHTLPQNRLPKHAEIQKPDADQRDWFGGGFYLFCAGNALDSL